MQVHTLLQGSPDWLAHRLQHYNASDAPAMMGCSPYKTRSQLIRELANGIGEEITEEKQELFDSGHRFEALARPLAEEIVGEELYPVVGSEGKLSASFDGLTMMETIGFEHKRLNKDLRAAFADMEGVLSDNAALSLPLHYRVQMEQQMMVSGAERILFMATHWERVHDFPEDSPQGWKLTEEHHCWYYPNPELADQIRRGWAQLDADVCAYVPENVTTTPTGAAPETLPALRIELSGKVISSNFDAFKVRALEVFKGIKTELKTDQDFADADKTAKWCEDIEDRLDAAKAHALSQAEPIDALLRAVDEIKAEARRVRLDLENKVKAEKQNRRTEIVTQAQAALDEHILGLNKRLGMSWITGVRGPFAEAIKGKKTIASCKESADAALAKAKIDTSALADRLDANRKHLKQEDKDWFFLFADFAHVGNAPAEVFEAVAAQRIQKHKDDEAKAEADRKGRELVSQPAPGVTATPAAATVLTPRTEPLAAFLPTRSAPTDDLPPINAGEIAKRLGFPLTREFIEGTLGVAHHARKGASVEWKGSDWQGICRSLIAHVQKVA